MSTKYPNNLIKRAIRIKISIRKIIRTSNFKRNFLYAVILLVILLPLSISIFKDNITRADHNTSQSFDYNNQLSPSDNGSKAKINSHELITETYHILPAAPNIGKADIPEELISLRKEINDYIGKFSGKYGIYFIDTLNGHEFGINEEDEFIAASTVKIPINLYLFNKINNGTANPEDVLTYTEADYEDGTGKILNEKMGTRYTVRELSMLSIESSDNIATNMLIRYLNRKNIKDFMRDLGGKIVDDEKNISCPKDMAVYMKEVYNFCRSKGPLGEELLDYFSNTEFNGRIPALLPKDIRIAHKIGSYDSVFHDIGIIYTHNPYILSIMSSDTDEEEAAKVIANISKKVYDYVQAN